MCFTLAISVPLLLSSRLLRSQSRFNGLRDLVGIWRRGGIESLQDFSITPNDEFAEIPFHRTGKGRLLAAERGIERMLLRAFDVQLVEQRKGHVVFARTELLDFIVC